MINFTIPGTGSSGHLGGGLILAILLGPHAAFLAMASVLTVQALFFADGGLLALGCNIFNLGFFPAFVAYPLIFSRSPATEPAPGASPWPPSGGRRRAATGRLWRRSRDRRSGISELPFAAFVLLMQPIHLAIGIVEGLVTAAVLAFVWKARPETRRRRRPAAPGDDRPLRNLLGAAWLLAALVTGGAPLLVRLGAPRRPGVGHVAA